MFEYLDKLREKPEQERKVIALSVAFFITLIIVVVWGGTYFILSKRSSLEGVQEKTSQKVGPSFGEVSDSARALKENVTSSFSQLKGMIEQLKQ